MSLKFFFGSIFLGLISIYVFFKPLYIKEQEFTDIPVFELKKFTLYEINKKGLTTFMSGDSTLKYENRYSVKNIYYTDNTKKQMLTMKATDGEYNGDIILLNNGVELYREDGLTFKAKRLSYDKSKDVIMSDSDYTLFRGKDKMEGSSIKYFNNLDKIESTNVDITYKLKEKI